MVSKEIVYPTTPQLFKNELYTEKKMKKLLKEINKTIYSKTVKKKL